MQIDSTKFTMFIAICIVSITMIQIYDTYGNCYNLISAKKINYFCGISFLSERTKYKCY